MSTRERISVQDIIRGNFRALARAITFIENGIVDFQQLLMEMPPSPSGIVGVTGPPGAGKSTLVDALIGVLIKQHKKVAVLCVDPSSSFHHGALLGDRIRMSDWYTHPLVFIRSLSSRGSLGGLHPRVPEIADLLKMAGFDYVFIETVGVGQSEIEIASLANTTIVVLVPEGGDEIQTMKAGIMEIADIFVVNKCDRPGADLFAKTLRNGREHGPHQPDPPPVIKTNALQKQGIEELAQKIEELGKLNKIPEIKYRWLTERAYYLIRNERMMNINKKELEEKIRAASEKNDFNLYRFVATICSATGKDPCGIF
jgi:LAO/AO transport system kinase